MNGYIFDMDGVLCESEEMMTQAACRMFETVYGVTVQPRDFEPFVGTGEDRYLGGVARLYGIELCMPRDKVTAYRLYGDLVEGRLRPVPGVCDFIQRASAAGVRLAVATSADRMKLEINLRELGLAESLFNALVTGCEMEHKKPAPDLFLKAAERMGLPPSACIVFEDAVNGVRAARAAGSRCIGVTSSFPAATLLAEGADETIADFTELAEGPLPGTDV